ncbi:MAG: thioredoxin domain-containing protein [Phycisphaerae bacterium]
MPRRLLAAAALSTVCVLLACRAERKEPPVPGHSSASPATATTRPAHTNRLARATSPYLQQHQHNPVDWYEWGPEALETARREDKPIFLSIGYSACHWCHVMAHESFENAEIATAMNRAFVNIKVDREERPDLDDLYMHATMIFNQGQGGWPMSVWLTPELKPFVAGTYYPPTTRWGRPGFKELCERIETLWKEKRAALVADAERVVEFMSREGATTQPVGAPALSLDVVDEVADLLAGAFDAERGGLVSGGTNKFPPSMALDLLLRSAHRRRDDDARRDRLHSRVRTTLDGMFRGGIWDQLAGGIARYSTDVEWLVPHFEKMLYDQALVSRIYLDAFQATGDAQYARAARDILDYARRDLRSPEGGFYSSRDADSEGVEGKYYVWQRGEIVAALGAADAELFCAYYDVSDAGNWRDPHEPETPKNILHRPRPLADVARQQNVDPAEAERRLAAARAKLLALRETRVPPHRDEKILCEWNGLMIASFARAAGVLNEPRYAETAAEAAAFLLKHQLRDGRLQRSYRDGRTLDTAFLSDYAALVDGLLDLYEATFERRWFDAAVALNRTAIELFWDGAGGGFFATAHDHEQLILRRKDTRDSATPSGNALQLMNLLRLGALLDDPDLRQMAERTVTALGPTILQSPGAAERFLCAVEFAYAGPVEIAVVGSPTDARTRALLRVVYETYLPNRVLMLLDPQHPEASPTSPLLEQRELVNGVPAAYVCRNYVCDLPATTAEALRGQLKR